QLEFGMETTTMCVPTETLMLIGVTLPVSSPSTDTLAPEGNEVTFNAPFCARALLGISKSTPVNTAIQTILVIQTILLGCLIESSSDTSHRSTPLRQLDVRCSLFRGMLK